jgi:hypothetical protein
MDHDRKTAFSLSDLKKLDIADKDNVGRQPKPPEHIQHPRLAPRGMGGIKLDRMPPPQPSREAAKRPTLTREVGKPSDINRAFKPIAAKTPGKDLGRGR